MPIHQLEGLERLLKLETVSNQLGWLDLARRNKVNSLRVHSLGVAQSVLDGESPDAGGRDREDHIPSELGANVMPS